MANPDYSSMSDEELLSLYKKGKSKPDYSTMSDDELISLYNQGKKTKKKRLEGATGIGAQYALGAAESALLPYEIGVLPLALPGGQEAMADLFTRDILSEVYPTEEEGKQMEPSELKEPINLGIRGLAEKATGLDLQPEGVAEKAANWSGFLKNPKKIKDLFKLGLTPKEALKSILPAPTEAIRGLTAGTALEMAEDGQFGPLGTLTAAVIGDVIGHGPKALLYAATHPKEVLARGINLLTGANSKNAWKQQLINDARASNIQLDIGSITQSPFIKMLQARAAQSGLTGTALDEFRKDLSGQIIREYESIASQLGDLTFENSHQAAEAVKSYLKTEGNDLIKNINTRTEGGRSLAGRITQEERPNVENQMLLERISPIEFQNDYVAGETLRTAAEDIREPLKEEFNQRWDTLNGRIAEIPPSRQSVLAQELERFVNDNIGSLLLGESTPEHRVITAAQNLLNQVRNERGLANITLTDLIKTKRTLADVANWEFGGSNFESKYKALVEYLDNAITRELSRANPVVLEEFHQLNAEYSMFKDTFENKNVLPLFEPKNQNYNAIYNSYVTNPDKLRSLEDMFYNNQRGQELIDQVKRDYAERIINRTNVNDRDIRNLSQTLGPQFEQDIQEYWQARQFLQEHPIPRPAPQQARIPFRAPEMPQLTGKARKFQEAEIHKRQKLYEFLSGKSSDQIMKQFDTIEGIRKMKSVMGLTEEGRQLFKELSRYKLSEIIDKNMTNSINEQVKLGTFSNLLKPTKQKAIVKELIGNENFVRLERLQKNAGRLAESASKFFNASQSGTTATDVGLICTAITATLMGNPYMALAPIATIGGMKVIANLFSNKEFLVLLEEAILKQNNPIKFNEIMTKMIPLTRAAVLEAKDSNENQRKAENF